MILTHHGINSLSRVQLYDLLYADANGKKHFVNPDAIPNPMPAGWELVGDVALLNGNKATVLYKTENASAKWASMWLFKVYGLKLDGTDTFVLQQGPASGSTNVEIGTFTASESATDLDTLVSELDTWLRANPTATGAFANYNWHAEKHEDADGVDSCFIVVDNAANNSRVSPIKSSASGASASIYMWNWTAVSGGGNEIIRRDDISTPIVLFNKEVFISYGSNLGSPTDSLTTKGIFNEAGFNDSTVVKEFYGTFENYLNYMVPKIDATTGVYQSFKGKGKQIGEKLSAISFKNLSGTDTAVFPAEKWASSVKAHSTASVEGLNAGDFFIASIDTMYKILSSMKSDGSDLVNASFVKAGSNAFDPGSARFVPATSYTYAMWRTYNAGRFDASYPMYAQMSSMAVAEINL